MDHKKYKRKYFRLKRKKHIGGAGDSQYILKLDTYDDYLKFAEENMGKDCKWIYDIIDKTDGLEKLLFETDNFVLVIEMSMVIGDLNTFHLLAFPKNKSIRSIRDLTAEHIPILKEMVSEGKKFITEHYGINENEIETHCHYPPGVLLLHIHFELVNNKKFRRPLREHSINEIIENLLINPDYYKIVTMEILKKK